MRDFAKKILANVEDGKEFILHHTNKIRKVKNLVDLKHEIQKMSDEEFRHHVNNEKNDFAYWIHDGIKDETLAKDIKHSKDQSECVDLLNARINFAVKILEQENKKLIEDELTRLQKISQKPEKISTEIEMLKEDAKKIEENIKIERNIFSNVNDSVIKSWDEMKPVPMHARIIEFIFGFAVGLACGFLLARVIFGI